MNIYLIACIQGIVEGLTEFLPVSSTGHLILTGAVLGFVGEKAKTFEVVIQLGAIMAIVLLYFPRILSLFGLGKVADSDGKQIASKLNLGHIALAMAPAVVLGLLFRKQIKAFLFYPLPVIGALVVGGLLLIFAEKKQPPVVSQNLDELSYQQAFKIGLFQCLALWPGFSRAGATIAGGLLCGTSHKAAADFSFIVAVPMMIAASGLDLVKSYSILSRDDVGYFAVGFLVSFIVAIVAVKFFLQFLDRVKLTPFAYYRFLVAIAFLFAIRQGWIDAAKF